MFCFLFIFFLFDVVLLNIVASSKILKVYHDYMASPYHMGIVSGFTLMSSYLESVESTGKTVCVTVLLSISFFSEMILCSNNSVSSEKDCFSQTIHDLLCLTNDLCNQMDGSEIKHTYCYSCIRELILCVRLWWLPLRLVKFSSILFSG
jgi:hypothetical protein